MHDIPRMTGGIRDDHAPPRAAFHDLAVADIDGHMAVLGFGPRAGADDIPRYGIAELKQPKRINYDSFRRALLLILWAPG